MTPNRDMLWVMADTVSDNPEKLSYHMSFAVEVPYGFAEMTFDQQIDIVDACLERKIEIHYGRVKANAYSLDGANPLLEYVE